jgi:hypothetical protein
MSALYRANAPLYDAQATLSSLLEIVFEKCFMIKLLSSSAIASAVLVLGLATPAHALSNRAWVSGHGADSAGCGSPASPCRTFQYVHDNIIAPSGEIDVLDPAGYGAVTINKALSIVNDGVGTAGVQATANQNAITINAGASGAVFLRGLDIDGTGTGNHGIVLNSGGSLTIVNCVVRHFVLDGIHIEPASGVTNVAISKTIASDNFYGIVLISDGMATFTAVIRQTTVANNGSAGAGIFIDNRGVGASATIVDSGAFNNSIGFLVGQVGHTGATLRLGRSVVTGNGIGVAINPGGTAQSYGDNKIDGNGTDVGGGTLSSVSNR